jgi:endo-1,4-beta-mannosidase
MHSSAETRFYSDIGGKPCIVEETGIMGPMEANEDSKAGFLRSILFNNWANDCHGLLWWCAYDQNKLDFPPYEWTSVERDLGLFRTDRSAKPVVGEISKFRKFLDSLPFDTLPLQKKEAVCILTDGQDQWGVAYSAYILAKQAGFDIEFQHGSQPVKKSGLYILPSIKGTDLLNRSNWLQILENVKNGATLYVSYDWGFLSHFLEPAGFEIITSQNRNAPVDFISNDKDIKPFSMKSGRRLNIKSTTAKVLAHEKDGNPVFVESKYGSGKIYFLAIPLEMNLTETPGGFTDEPAECWKIYHTIAADLIRENRVVRKNDPFVGITEHDLSATEKLIVMVNYTPSDRYVSLSINEDWKVNRAFYGVLPEKSKVKLNANDACVLHLKRE